MRDDYKIKGPTVKVELEVEPSVLENLQKMEIFTKLTKSEITNTALKRFITQHKDFLPPEAEKKV